MKQDGIVMNVTRSLPATRNQHLDETAGTDNQHPHCCNRNRNHLSFERDPLSKRKSQPAPLMPAVGRHGDE
jgi:hypothetical protein